MNPVQYEIDIVEKVSKKIRQLEYQNKNKIDLKSSTRENNGKLSGSTSFTFNPDSVVILEGHYTLETRLTKFIDLNILLLGSSKELIKNGKLIELKIIEMGKMQKIIITKLIFSIL